MAWLVLEQSEMEMLFNGEAGAGAEAAAGCLAKTFVGVVAAVGGSREVDREVTGRKRTRRARMAARRAGPTAHDPRGEA